MVTKPQIVTFTGLDLKTDLERVQRISTTYPEAEWGILAGSTNTIRYSAFEDFDFMEEFESLPVRKALHLCGEFSRVFQRSGLLPIVFKPNRIQVNMKSDAYNEEQLRTRQEELGTDSQIILQWRGEKGFPQRTPFSWLFDKSGGRGIYNDQLPKNDSEELVGYAGGINPSNVLITLDLIKAKNFWIDMETGIRTNDYLDLDKVELVLETIWPERT